MDVSIVSPLLNSEPATSDHLSCRHYVTGKAGFFAGKRIIDIVLSLGVLLLLLSWLTPLVAILLALDSKGPVFFTQRRVGRSGRSFVCYKFRTMVVNTAAHRQPACVDDRRITPLGAWLRMWHIDELPQFLNVLLGQMSVVGPRPHMYADCHAFSALIPRYKMRNLVRPGITGLAQIKGVHGPVPNPETARLRYYWDVYYLRNACARLDFMILIKTLIGSFHRWPHNG